jgi:hypothetical protein
LEALCECGVWARGDKGGKAGLLGRRAWSQSSMVYTRAGEVHLSAREQQPRLPAGLSTFNNSVGTEQSLEQHIEGAAGNVSQWGVSLGQH